MILFVTAKMATACEQLEYSSQNASNVRLSEQHNEHLPTFKHTLVSRNDSVKMHDYSRSSLTKFLHHNTALVDDEKITTFANCRGSGPSSELVGARSMQQSTAACTRAETPIRTCPYATCIWLLHPAPTNSKDGLHALYATCAGGIFSLKLMRNIPYSHSGHHLHAQLALVVFFICQLALLLMCTSTYIWVRIATGTMWYM